MSSAGAVSQALASGSTLVLDAAAPRSLADAIRARIEEYPNGIVRTYRETGQHQTQSYVSLWRRSGNIAACLTAAGARPSTPVVILAEDILGFLPAFWACLRAGFIAVPLTSAAKDAIYRDDRAFDAALSTLKNYFVLADDAIVALAQRYARTLPGTVIELSTIAFGDTWIDPEATFDPACLVATSGTTGRLKLVELSNSALVYRNYARKKALGSKIPHSLGATPLDTIAGQTAVCLHADEWTQISSNSIASRPAVILDAIEELRISHLGLTGSMIGRILHDESRENRSRNLASLQSIGVGAEPISTRLVQEFAQLLLRYGANPNVLGSGYGTTETGALATGSRDFLNASSCGPACLGAPRAGVKMRIVGKDRSVIGNGEIGELEVYCPEKMFSGYWGDTNFTHEGFTLDGWWKTGDLGRLKDGELYLHGRAKEVFIQNGKKFSFADIDDEMRNSLKTGDVAYAFTASRPGEPDELAVVFAVSEFSDARDFVDRIRTALIRRFGISPGLIVEAESHLIPKTAAGKLQRWLLNDLFNRSSRLQFIDRPTGYDGKIASSWRASLEAVWKDALGIDGAVDPEANFFDLGGDSLRSLSLHHRIIESFGVDIPSDEFFEDPTFERLLRLVANRSAAANLAKPKSDISWPLPPGLRNDLLSALETWPGERPTPARTMLALNSGGTRPPLFWVFNSVHEFSNLAKALGDDQPLFAFRSGTLITNYPEDDIQAFALRYLSDIVEVYPEGPFFVGGNCQGGIIALAIAQHALRRKRHVPLLVLMDWSFALQAYPGRVLLVSGCDNFHHNAARRFARPELAWKRTFASHEFVEMPGSYAQGFDENLIGILAEILTTRIRSALSEPPTMLPRSGYRATIAAYDVPAVMQISSSAMIKIVVGQDSDISWNSTRESGIVVACRWIDAAGRALQKAGLIAELPQMPPHSSAAVDLTIVAPDTGGDFILNIALREEGHGWFSGPESGFRAPISIIP